MTLKYKVNKSSELVFDYLTNMSKFVLVHPVINDMQYLGGNKFRVFETLNLGIFPYSFTYSAYIEINYESKKVVMTATVMDCNIIEMVFDIKEIQGGALIKEVISFKTKLPVKLILRQIFKKQHAALFRNIDNCAGETR